MKSSAHFKGHPIHPMLVPFPIAFFTGTLLFHVLALLYDDNGFMQTALHLNLAGIIAALITAFPGIIDYFYTVPPKSTAKSRAAKHGLTNTSVVVLFTVAYFYRQSDDALVYAVVAMELTGVMLMVIAGWMGGTLVYRNQIGVDPRHAHAGKWKEVYIDNLSDRIEVAQADELKVDQMKLLHVKDRRIVLGRTEDKYVAFDDRCSHRGGSLAGGMMICGTVQCPWHGSQFDIQTGEVKAGPAQEKINTYKVEESNGKVYLII